VSDLDGLRVAIVHERFTELGGSERCVEQFHALWPDAPVHTTLLDRAILPPALRDADIRPAPMLQRLYRGGSYAHLLPLLPAAMRSIDVGDVDLVVASHHAFSNRVRAPAHIPVVSYVHTPGRWIWQGESLADEVGSMPARLALRAYGRSQRTFDRAAAARLAGVVANSRHVATQVEGQWGRAAEVVHPPVDTDFYTPDPSVSREDFFLFAGRLIPYKQPEVAVAAAATAGVHLVVAGDGRSRAAVEAVAGPHTELVGTADFTTLRDLYRRCRALVFPGEEYFGLVPVEAQACGAPVIARKVGGVVESVVDGETGVLYEGEGPEPLVRALEAFDPTRFDADRCRARAEVFSQQAFRADFLAAVERILSQPSLP
jgi:glycosyltransferase involved in cell wall biosynthesis